VVRVLMDIVSNYISRCNTGYWFVTLRMRARDGASNGRDASFTSNDTKNVTPKNKFETKICPPDFVRVDRRLSPSQKLKAHHSHLLGSVRGLKGSVDVLVSAAMSNSAVVSHPHPHLHQKLIHVCNRVRRTRQSSRTQ